MVGNDQEVQRPSKTNSPGGRGIDLLTAGETIRLVQPKAIAEGAGIHRVRRVQVRVAPEYSRRRGARRIRGVGQFRVLALGFSLGRQSGVLRK